MIFAWNNINLKCDKDTNYVESKKTPHLHHDANANADLGDVNEGKNDNEEDESDFNTEKDVCGEVDLEREEMS